jgi:methyl-accepting chemotaxis protein
VAEEVRNLSVKTTDNASEISEVIKNLIAIADKAVEIINQCNTKVQETVDTSAEASNKISEISDSIEKLNDNISSVAAATEEQSVVSDHIADSVHGLTAASNRQFDEMVSTEQSVTELNNSITALKEKISDFKV